jgi:Cu+-exporting ATPase
VCIEVLNQEPRVNIASVGVDHSEKVNGKDEGSEEELVVLNVTGMMCQNNCGATVQRALQALSNVRKCEVSFELGEAKVWGTPKLATDDLITAVECVGFGCTVKPAVVLSVKGMMCQNSCGATVKRALDSVAGVERSEVSFELSEARVWGSKCNVSDLISEVENVGFECTVATVGSRTKYENHKSSHSAKKHTEKPPVKAFVNNDLHADTYLLCKVRGMNCASCERSVQDALAKLNGVSSVRVSLIIARVEITFCSDRMNSNVIISTITSLGYSAELIDCKPLKDMKNKLMTFHVPALNSIISKKLTESIGGLNGIVNVSTDLQRCHLAVEYDDLSLTCVGPRDVRDLIEGMDLECYFITPENDQERNKSSNEEVHQWFNLLCIAMVFGLPVLALHLAMSHYDSVMMMLDMPAICGDAVSRSQVIMLILNTPLQFGVGYRFYRSAWLGAMHGNYGMDCLVVVGTSITFFYSLASVCFSCGTGIASKHTFFEASGMLILFVTLGKFLESFAKRSTYSSMETLLSMQPTEVSNCSFCDNDAVNPGFAFPQAFLVLDAGKGRTPKGSVSYGSLEIVKRIELHMVQRNDLLKVFPGSKIPTDGCIEIGSSFIDESMITGKFSRIFSCVELLVLL